MIRACGSQIVCGDGGRIKSRPCNMIRACGSQGMRLIKVSTIFNHYLKHAKNLTKIPQKYRPPSDGDVIRRRNGGFHQF